MQVPGTDDQCPDDRCPSSDTRKFRPAVRPLAQPTCAQQCPHLCPAVHPPVPLCSATYLCP
ncbi:unnamed protein product, partial [Staurois parvus]